MAISEESFLRAFFAEDEYVCMRAFADKKGKNLLPVKYRFCLKELSDYLPEMHAKNREGYGIHFVVNYGGHTDKEIQRINAVFFENDKFPFDEQLKKIYTSPIEPSIIVKTSRSLHTYFLVKDVPLNKFRELQERIAYFFDADMQLKNESHTMRMPNFYHMKDEPVMVVVAKFNPEIRYSFSEIDAVFPKDIPKANREKHEYILSDVYDSNAVISYMRKKLKVRYEKSDKIVCHCLFPERHTNNDASPSAVFFKDSLYFYCSGCGASYHVDELALKMEWHDLLRIINK